MPTILGAIYFKSPQIAITPYSHMKNAIVACFALCCALSNANAATLNLVPSWNLLGNSVNAPLTVATTFNNSANVSTVWKWVPATSKWAFYTPALADGGAAYAATKGYDFLTTINGGEGFWVNAKGAFTASLPAGTAIASSSFQVQNNPALNKLLTGWNLIGTGDSLSPSAFNQALSVTPPALGTIPTNVTSLWAWDSTLMNWYFYAPSLEASGGLTSYITSKNYLNFGTKVLDPAMGFWVNYPAAVTAAGGPGITMVLPASALTGASITIIGTNFTQVPGNVLSGANYLVSFNGTAATPYLRTLSQLAVMVPVGATTGPITVTDLTTNQVYTVPGIFTVTGATGGTTGGTATTITPVGMQMGGARQGTSLALSNSVSLFAGSLLNYNGDGTGSAAGFYSPIGITTDGVNLFIADAANNQIRQAVIATGAVTTIAGGGSGYNATWSPNYAKPGALDGIGLATSFSTPKWITTDGTNLYVTDQANFKIRKIVIATGVVSTLAGSGTPGSVDGAGTAASFSALEGITTDGLNLYVVDGGKIRQIVITTGAVSTLALVDTNGVAVNPPSLGITTDGTNLYLTDGGTVNSSIRKIAISTGIVTILAGGNPLATGCQDIDAIGTAAAFCKPRGITTDGTNLYVAENDFGISTTFNQTAFVRKIVIATGQVSTLAGGAQCDANGIGTLAGFRSLNGITSDGKSLFATDLSKIRQIQ